MKTYYKKKALSKSALKSTMNPPGGLKMLSIIGWFCIWVEPSPLSL